MAMDMRRLIFREGAVRIAEETKMPIAQGAAGSDDVVGQVAEAGAEPRGRA